MAFLKNIETGFGVVGIWEITETLAELEIFYDLQKNDSQELSRISAERRKKEFLIVRILLKQMLGFAPEIVYENSGKPKLANSTLNISISHSSDLVVVFLSEKNIGIDVERLDRNIDKVAPRFLHSSEMDFVEKNKNQQQLKIILWSAKEAIFKSCREQGIQFNSEIIIQPFSDAEDSMFSGKHINKTSTNNFKLWFFICKNNVVVYCVEEE